MVTETGRKRKRDRECGQSKSHTKQISRDKEDFTPGPCNRGDQNSIWLKKKKKKRLGSF